MANEDSRENSVVGGAMKVAAVGAAVYGVTKGGRGLIKNYDDLGRTFGKAGDKVSKSIKSGLSKFDKADGSGNVIKEGLDKIQSNILNKDYAKSVSKSSNLHEKISGEGLKEDYVNALHESYASRSVNAKRDILDNRKEMNKGFKKEVKTRRIEEAEAVAKKKAEEAKAKA